MTKQPQQSQAQQEPAPKKVIALVSNGKTTFLNPDWQFAPCPNCNGRKCVLCSMQGVYRE